MRSKILLSFALFVGITAFSQTKVGTVDSDFIISKMPEMIQVTERVQLDVKKLDSSFQLKTTEYKTKVDAFKATETWASEEDKKAKYEELIALENEIKSFRQNGTQLMQLRKDEFMKPLYKKLTKIIAEVAKENNYTQILTTGGNQFGYIDERFDITDLVLNKLGIKE